MGTDAVAPSWGGLTVFALGVALGTRWSATAGHAAESGQTNVPPLVHQGDQIVIPTGSPLRFRLVVQQVAGKDSPHVLQVPAAVEADPARTVNILAPVTGKVVQLLVRLGDRVAKAYTDDDKAPDTLARSERAPNRARGLSQAGVGAAKDLEQAESDWAQARAECTRAEARLAQIGVHQGANAKSRLLTVRSPIAGSVTTLATSSDAMVNDPTSALMTVANLDSVWVTANVPEEKIATITKGEAVEVIFPAYPSERFRGTVSFLSGILEPDTHRKGEDPLRQSQRQVRPNMLATTSFQVPQHQALFVLNDARTTVFMETAHWTFEKGTVTPSYGAGDGTRIDGGLKGGERVLAKGGVAQ